MGDGGFVGRVGRLAVLLGVGGSVLFGVGCAVASADDTGTGGPSRPPSSASADKQPSKESAKKPPRESTRSGGDAVKDGKRRHAPKRGSAVRPKDAGASTEATGVGRGEPDAPDKTPEKTPDNTAGTTTKVTAPVHETSAESTIDSASTRRVERPEPKPSTVASVLSTVVDGVLHSAGPAGLPDAPAVQPQLVASLAASRRELRRSFAAPASDQGRETAATTTEPVTKEAAKVAAPSTASLTYTAGPSFTDQVTVLGIRVLRAVSNVIGVDLFGEFNKLLISKSPPFFVNYGLDARKDDVELTDGTTWTVWKFTPPNPTGKTVVAVHGSGFIYEPNVMQWYDYTSMARDTGATVVVPIYPLATTAAGSALNVVPDMADFISGQIVEHGAGNVSVYGDSAGSTIAISAVRQLVLAGKPVPSNMVLLSLTPDGSLSNPDIENTDDPVIDVNHLGDYAQTHWADGITDPKSPYYNALYFDTLAGLPPTTVYVGSTEFILPDTLLLYQKALDDGAPISFVVGQGQIHDWPLGGLPINSQAPVVRPDVYRQLGLIGEAVDPSLAS